MYLRRQAGVVRRSIRQLRACPLPMDGDLSSHHNDRYKRLYSSRCVVGENLSAMYR